MNDLDHIRRMTLLYPHLQGLRMVPIGLFLLVVAVQRLELLPFLGREGDCTVTLPLLIFVVLLSVWIGRYYQRTFGAVEPLESTTNRALQSVLLIGGFIGIIVLDFILASLPVKFPFSVLGLGFGCAYLALGIKTQRWYYTFTGALNLIASFLPGITGSGLDNQYYGSGGIVFTILLGVTILFTSLLDHFRLVRAFAEIQGDPHGGNAG